MPHQFKLIYFPSRGRGEHLRYILAYSGVQHELVYPQLSDWPQLKPKTQFGSLPVLVVDGTTEISQSMVIGQFLAAELGLAGTNHLEATKVFMLAHGINDLQEAMMKLEINQYLQKFFGKQDFNKAKELWKSMADVFTTFCDRYEKWLGENGGQWLVGTQCSWADLFFAELMQRIMVTLQPDALDKHPLLKALHHRVHQIPNIQKRVEQQKTQLLNPF